MVTHNLGVAAYMGDKVIVMQHGTIMDQGDRGHVLRSPQSEYTRSLIAAVPTLEGERYV